MKIEEKTYYIDVTNKWLKNSLPNRYKVIDQLYYEHESKKYKVEGKKVVLDYSKKEKEVAKWLSKTFGGSVYMIPRINNPEGIKTPDYIFRGERWDLKEINGSSRNAIDDAIKNKKKQANNFIIDITNTTLSVNEILYQVKKIFRSEKRYWVNIIIIKQYKNLIAVLKRR